MYECPLYNIAKIQKKCEKTYGFSTFNFTLYIGINGLIPDIGTHYLMDDYYYGRNKKKEFMLLEKVNNITEWINEIEPGEVKSAYLPCARLQSLNCLASRFNQSRGKERDKFVHYHFCSDLEIATLVCETREEYLINKQNGEENCWKTQIPKDFR